MLEWPTILEAIGLAQTGDRTTGRQALLACWEQTDTTALAEYAHLRVDDLSAVGIPDAAGLAPSLHLNLGDGFLRQGRTAEAAEQLRAGLGAVAALGDDGYGRMIRDGLDRLASRIDSAESSAGR